MSLAIQLDDIHSVRIGRWYDVKPGSFCLDSYEFMDGDSLRHGGGDSSVCATGFRFVSPEGETISGPLSAIQAVKELG